MTTPRPRGLDALFGLAACVGWMGSASLWLGVPPSAVAADTPFLWARWVDVGALAATPAGLAQGASVAVLAGLLAAGRATLAAELGLVVLLHIAAVVECAVRGVPSPSTAPILMGQIFAVRALLRVIARRRGLDEHALTTEGAWAVVGATFTLAAIAKLRVSGLGWTDARTHALLVVERRDSAIPAIAAFRQALLDHPVLISVGTWGTLLTELTGPLVAVPRLRRVWAVAASAMVVAWAVALGIVLPTWGGVPLALALFTPRADPLR